MSDHMECPPPLPDRIGHIGGIESITMDGQRYFFGFDFRCDVVVSPLIADVDVMAAFASRYMEQTDGQHDPAYWRELVQDSIDISELSDDDDARTFSSGQLRYIAESLRRGRTDNTSIPGFDIEYHLLYLLGAASRWPVSFVDAEAALSNLGLDLEDLNDGGVDDSIAFLNGTKKLPLGAAYADPAIVLQNLIHAYVNGTPDNWRTLFLPIVSG